MPAIVQPVRMPPTSPAMNGQMAFKAALSIPAQSISSFMLLFPFLVLVMVCGRGVLLGAVQYVGSTGPTVLPIRKVPLALMSDPLDNHEIAFGVVHFALRRFP